MADEWISLAPFESHAWQTNFPVVINDNEFGRCSGHYKDKHSHKYVVDRDEWVKWLDFPLQARSSLIQLTSTYHSKKQCLYMYAKGGLMKINTKTNKSQVIPTDYRTGHSAQCIMIDDEFHVIGGYGSNKHLKWNETEQKLETVHTFSDARYFTKFSIIYLESRSRLLFMGGSHGPGKDYMDNIYIYDTKTKQWTYTEYKMPQKLYFFGSIACKEDKYVIIFGGKGIERNKKNTIWIMDVDTMEFKESGIVCPMEGYFQAVLMGSNEKRELLTFGFVRCLWKTKEFVKVNELPLELVGVIASYYCTEYVHLLEEKGNHWKIQLDRILSEK